MRFLPEGPNFPDELLLARDEGRLVIFCGSGVSRAFAGLPDFFRLAKDTLNALSPTSDSPAKVAFEQIEHINAQDYSSPLSIDRVFGLLEYEFEDKDIENAIGNALRHTPSPNLQAHRALLGLARSPSGLTRLVTTNFDHLFELSDPTLPCFYPPALPDPDRPSQFNGIIYLHGKLRDDYESAEGDGLVLSSSAFGNAYLSQGWATEFFVKLINKYSVLFVGYSADDPPITYLLEGLRKDKGMLKNAYALQAALNDDSTSQWARKGIELIPYRDDNNHALLWNSIAKWADRAEDPQLWVDDVIERARSGPASLLPHERGQVAHVISTRQGMRRFAEGNRPPPAEWLCVFDRSIRYLTPGHNDPFNDSEAKIDPFEHYGLDSDSIPAFVLPEWPNEKRQVPSDAWSGFDLTRLDLKDLQKSLATKASAIWFEREITLPPRLMYMGLWLRKCAKDPALLWWLLRTQHLHRTILDQIYEHAITTSDSDTFNPITAISQLRMMWSRLPQPNDLSAFDLESEVSAHGWSQTRMDAYLDLKQPYLELQPSLSYGVCPPSSDAISADDLIHRRLAYPHPPISPVVPDEWLTSYVPGIRRNLEHACRLSANTSAYSFYSLPSIHEDPSDHRYGRDRGLAHDVIEYCNCMERLIQYDLSAARTEFRRWPSPSDPLFSRLHIWALRIRALVPPSKVLGILRAIPRPHLWSAHNARDLFRSLESRWNDLLEAHRHSVEARLAKGPEKNLNETAEQYETRHKIQTLELFEFLEKSGCKLAEQTLDMIKQLREDLPHWDSDSALELPRSMGPRGGMVGVDTDFSLLLTSPISNVVQTAREISHQSSHFLVRKDPFLGLSRDRPCRAISALRAATFAENLPKREWEIFLNEPARAEDRFRLVQFIAQLLLSYPNEAIAPIIASVSEWLRTSSHRFAQESQAWLNAVLTKIISIHESHPTHGFPKDQISKGPRDWASESINSPVGKLAQILFEHPSVLGLEKNATFPSAWKKTVKRLLNLDDQNRSHALVIFGYCLSYCYSVDPAWTESSLLARLANGNKNDEHAIWAGYIWQGKVPHAELFPRLKPYLLKKSKADFHDDDRSVEVAATHLTAGWISKVSSTSDERFVTDSELRTALIEGSERFRTYVLREFQYKLTHSSGESLSHWIALSIRLFETVWPLQSKIKTPNISSSLCGILFANTQSFADVFPYVHRFLTVIYPNHYAHPAYRHGWDAFIQVDAEKVLEVLFITLPEDPNDWPYEIEKAVMSLVDTDPGLKLDSRYLELMRRWNSR